MVNAVPVICTGAFLATRVENRGESIITANPQISNKKNNQTSLKKNNVGEIKQHVPDIIRAIVAVLRSPHFRDKYPPAIHAKLPIAIIINDHKEISKEN